MYSTRFTLPQPHVIAGATGLALAMGVGRFAFTPLLPLMQEDMGVSIADGSWLASANYIGYLIGALLALSIRVDARAAIRAGLALTAASTLAMGLIASFPVWLALRGVAGFASAFLLVYVSAWTLEHIGSDPIARAGVFSGVGAGIFVVGCVCLTLNSWSVRAADVWIALGIGSSLLAALVWRVYESPVVTTSRPAMTNCLSAGAWRLIAAYAAAGFGYIIPATFLPAMARGQSTESALVDLAWPALGVAACASTFIPAAFFPRAGSLRSWKFAQAVMALGVSLPAFSHNALSLVLSGVCVGGTFMVVTMAAMEAARERGGRDPRRLMAVLTAAFASGQIAGPMVVASLIRAGGDFSIPLAIAAAALAAGVLVLPSTTSRPITTIARKEF